MPQLSSPTKGAEELANSDGTEVLPFTRHKFTMNADAGDGFTCVACGHWTYINETEWGDLFVCNPSRPKRFGRMYGREPFRFCPSCGAMVVTTEQWAEIYPQDQGKTLGEIAKRFYEK